jgi:hypothetical protein
MYCGRLADAGILPWPRKARDCGLRCGQLRGSDSDMRNYDISRPLADTGSGRHCTQERTSPAIRSMSALGQKRPSALPSLLGNESLAGRSNTGDLYNHLTVLRPCIVRSLRRLRVECASGICFELALIPLLARREVERAR